jgi:hypothetical protein
VALLVPNCPVCHQTMSLLARHLEANGIATVVMGAAKDIVELCGVPRLLFSDMPLGNAAARPGDPTSQDQTLELALRVLESAPGPRTTVQNPLRWNGPADWRLDYMNVERLSADRGRPAARRQRTGPGRRAAGARQHAVGPAAPMMQALVCHRLAPDLGRCAAAAGRPAAPRPRRGGHHRAGRGAELPRPADDPRRLPAQAGSCHT